MLRYAAATSTRSTQSFACLLRASLTTSPSLAAMAGGGNDNDASSFLLKTKHGNDNSPRPGTEGRTILLAISSPATLKSLHSGKAVLINDNNNFDVSYFAVSSL